MPPRIMIATPTADRKIYTRYMLSVMDLVNSGPRIGVEFMGPYFTEGALLSHSRNALVSMMLEDAGFSHILFVDSDMGFTPDGVVRLLRFDQPFVAAAYPAKHLDLRRVSDLARKGAASEKLASTSFDYIGAADVETAPHPETGQSSVPLRDGFARTSKVGMGLTLIRRDALDIMRAKLPHLEAPADRTYQQLGVRTKVFQAFTGDVQENGIYLSEDISFCTRWCRLCGGEIWLDTAQTTDHVGPWQFSGQMIDRLRS